jgi:hypothetical protein
MARELMDTGPLNRVRELENSAHPPPSNPDSDIHTAARLRSVNYMVNHICEPIRK